MKNCDNNRLHEDTAPAVPAATAPVKRSVLRIEMTMIDREARNRMAIGLRRLICGRVTNYDFDLSIERSEDRAISEIFWGGAWHLYSDLDEYKLSGKKALSLEDKEVVCRWIMFLKTDFEYKWPVLRSGLWLHWMVLAFVTFGLSERIRMRVKTVKKNYEMDYWPFRNANDYEIAKNDPKYFVKNIRE